MFLTIIASGVALLLFLIIRYRSQMAAFVAWIIGSVRLWFIKEDSDGSSPEDKSTSSQVNKTNFKSSKKKPKSSKKEITKNISKLKTLNPDISSKYQALLVEDTRRRSINFDDLKDKLEEIQESAEAVVTVLTPKKPASADVNLIGYPEVPKITLTEAGTEKTGSSNTTKELVYKEQSVAHSEIPKSKLGKKKKEFRDFEILSSNSEEDWTTVKKFSKKSDRSSPPSANNNTKTNQIEEKVTPKENNDSTKKYSIGNTETSAQISNQTKKKKSSFYEEKNVTDFGRNKPEILSSQQKRQNIFSLEDATTHFKTSPSRLVTEKISFADQLKKDKAFTEIERDETKPSIERTFSGSHIKGNFAIPEQNTTTGKSQATEVASYLELNKTELVKNSSAAEEKKICNKTESFNNSSRKSEVRDIAFGEKEDIFVKVETWHNENYEKPSAIETKSLLTQENFSSNNEQGDKSIKVKAFNKESCDKKVETEVEATSVPIKNKLVVKVKKETLETFNDSEEFETNITAGKAEGVVKCEKSSTEKKIAPELNTHGKSSLKSNKNYIEKTVTFPPSSIIEHYKSNKICELNLEPDINLEPAQINNKVTEKVTSQEQVNNSESEIFNKEEIILSEVHTLKEVNNIPEKIEISNKVIDKISQEQLHTSDTETDSNKTIEKAILQEEIETKVPNITNIVTPPQVNIPTDNSSEQLTTMKTVSEVRVLTLNDKEHLDSTLYRIEKNWTLQFRLGPSLLGRKVSLYCNYPQAKERNAVQFNRDRYYLLPWKQEEGCKNSDDTALVTEITASVAGSFHYYFIYENASESGPHGSGFFLVDPVLKYGNNEELPLNCIQCQTVLSKCLGPLSTWENKLKVAKESGYNMIHFTPIQELGDSNSAYSLSGQLKLNPSFNDNKKKTTFADIENFISKMRSEWKILSICDIVLNHTANETDWLQDHPESTYNCQNCTYMRPAYLLDAALHRFSFDVKSGLYEHQGVPDVVCTEDHLNAIRHALHTKVLPEINLAEMYICDVNKLVSEFLDRARKVPPKTTDKKPDRSLNLIQDSLYRRMASTVDLELALQLYNVFRSDTFDEDARLKRCGEEFKIRLDQLNQDAIDTLNSYLHSAVENCIAGIRYFRVQHDGPRLTDISIKDPLIPRYFTDYGNPKTVKEFEELMYGLHSKHLMTHNGWIMNGDPMKNFAEDASVYIKRELIAWSDSVKLRFGNKPEDSPFLWNHMKQYVELTAKIFDGVRLDNCHSTPIPVAEYLLDCARRVRPDLYVVAELFTNSDHTDNIFVNRMGITSLIREAMSAWDSHEEGRLVHRYGGEPVGAFFQPHFRPLVPSIAHALFLDLTHDNPSPVEKRSVFDMLPSAALVNMACCASGSNRGYDELVNHNIHVVDETRQYTEWTNDVSQADNPQFVSIKTGIIAAKRAINDLHFRLGVDGFSQVYIDQIDPDIVAVTRHHPLTHQSVVLVAFTAFGHPHMDAANYQRGIKPLKVEGVLDEIILEATLSHKGAAKDGPKYAYPENFTRNDKWINGLNEYEVDIKQHIKVADSSVFQSADSGNANITQLNFVNFKPGSVVAIQVSQPKNVQESIKKLRELTLSFARKETSDLAPIIQKLNLADLNRVMYRCDQEERDEGKGFGAYNIPNFGSLVYCGLQGFMSLLSTIRPSNDLGHPMCGNLRDGNWMIDYIWQRLKLDDGTKDLGQWIESNIQPLKNVPRFLVPSYFDVIITGLYICMLEHSYNLMSDFIKNGSTFVKGLSLGSLQFAAVIKSAELPTLSPKLAPPKPPVRVNDLGKVEQACATLSAGLPHFSTGYMRNWGRDTFIALRGLFILTGRYQDARYHILGYAACMRHGLIPNLLDGGRNSRFNCRDAVWWWLYCIKSYVEEAPHGIEILSDMVSRIFPTDDSPATEPGAADQPLYDVMQEALNVHFQGLTFRERNAGRQIDAQMNDKGFNNQIGVHPETGFVFGGNDANCGTWMDKMGSSDKAGIRGKPATPRDGSAIELIGLSKSVVTWLAELHHQKKYPYEGVKRVGKNSVNIKWSFRQWAEKIQNNFEKYFWVNTTPTEDEIRPDLINKRGIYKDSYEASQPWTDFQLRCNFPIAMVAAPEMFDPKHAWIALQNAEKHLLGPLGMKTLDPEDWAYSGDYDNSDDSDNPKTAHGFNYHQGPEWVWPIGYFLRAKLHFALANNEIAKTLASIKFILSKHYIELQTSSWRGLPELTNSNGSFCNDSSRTQAWSMSAILEVLYDLQKIEATHQLPMKN